MVDPDKITCPECLGSGECQTCEFDDPECEECQGSGNCDCCDGKGKIE
jgi:hypothetical protein